MGITAVVVEWLGTRKTISARMNLWFVRVALICCACVLLFTVIEVLTVIRIDVPAAKGTATFVVVMVTGATVADTSMSIDNAQFTNCHFRNVEIVYSGGPVLMQNCKFDNCTWAVQGAAAMAIDSLARCGWKITLPPKSWTVGG
jgi:hypothetical protein